MAARGWLSIIVVILLVVAGAFAWIRLEGSAPMVEAPEAVLVGVDPRSVSVAVSDEDSGPREIVATLVHARGEESLLAESYPGSWISGGSGEPAVSVEIEVDPKLLPRGVENAFLRISARDWSWRGGFRGNETVLELPVTLDRKPPRVSVFTGLTYVRRGGAGVVVYTTSEPTVRDGVQVGDTFFRSYPLGERRVAMYAVPTDAPENPRIRVVAEDAAGNEGGAGWAVVVRERELPKANVTLPPRFLENKVPDLAHAENIDTTDLVAAFDAVNTDVRSANEASIRAALADSAPERLWKGAFEQMPNSKVTSRFAEQRRYFVDGRAVSRATHFGYDLASTRMAPIPAANAGRVVFADDLGIYGNCVLVDHGLGVGSLYGHLSHIEVSPGDRVEKGQALGVSGETGLAGGDHLHFAILVGGTYVDPLEWWDAKWVRTNIEDRIVP